MYNNNKEEEEEEEEERDEIRYRNLEASFVPRTHKRVSFLSFFLIGSSHCQAFPLARSIQLTQATTAHTHKKKKRERKFQLKRDIYSRIRYIEERVPGGVWFLSIHALHVIYFFIFFLFPSTSFPHHWSGNFPIFIFKYSYSDKILLLMFSTPMIRNERGKFLIVLRIRYEWKLGNILSSRMEHCVQDQLSTDALVYFHTH